MTSGSRASEGLDGGAARFAPVVVRAALRLWHDPHLGESELASRSGLVRRRVADERHADTPMARGLALRNVLADALAQMIELGFADDAALLRRQFVKGDPIYTIASDLAVGERAYFKRQRKAIESLAAVLDAMEADAARDREIEVAGEGGGEGERAGDIGGEVGREVGGRSAGEGGAGDLHAGARTGGGESERAVGDERERTVGGHVERAVDGHVERAGGDGSGSVAAPFQAPPVPGWWVGRPVELAWLVRRLRPASAGEPGAAEARGSRGARGGVASAAEAGGSREGRRREASAAAAGGSRGGRRVDEGRTVVIAGMAGAGKSALAARAARRVRARFPDGVIWVDAAGLDADAALMFVARALRRDERVARTDSTAARAAIVRDLVNRRALLIVADGVESDDLVRALQPSAGRSRLLVTTRRADLPSLFGAPVRMVKGLRPRESLRLLRQAAGTERVDAERDAAAALAAVCGHLPLAVAVAGRLAHAHPRRSLDEIGERLRDAPLDRLRIDDRAVVRAAIEAAWEALEARRAAFLAALGAFEDRITPETAMFVGDGTVSGAEWVGRDRIARETTAVAGDPQAQGPSDAWEAGEWLEALADRSLLVRGHGDEYRMHTLVRALARERLDPDVTMPRLCAGYSGALADTCGRLDTAAWPEALTWLDAERRTVDALFAWAEERSEQPEAAAFLVACGGRCTPYFERRPDPTAWRRWSEAGLAAAMGDEDEAGIAACRVQLGVAAYRQGQLDEAEASLLEARAAYATLSEARSGAHATLCLAAIGMARGRLDDAIALSAESRQVARDLGAVALQARAENIHGLALARGGREAEAVTAFEGAIAAARDVGDAFAEGFARSNLAEICGRTGRTETAIGHALRAIEIAEAVDSPARIARCLDTLGELQLGAGDGPSARATYRRMRGVLAGMDPRPSFECLALEIGLGRADMQTGRWRAAASRLRRARSIAVSSASELGLAEALRHTAALLLHRPGPDRERDRARALRVALRAVGHYQALGRAVGRERAWRIAVEAAGGEEGARDGLEAGAKVGDGERGD